MSQRLRAFLKHPGFTTPAGAVLGAILSLYPIYSNGYERGKNEGMYSGIDITNEKWERKVEGQIRTGLQKAYGAELKLKDDNCKLEAARNEEVINSKSKNISELENRIIELRQAHNKGTSDLENRITGLNQELLKSQNRIKALEGFANVVSYSSQILNDLRVNVEKKNRAGEEYSRKRFFVLLNTMKEAHDSYSELAKVFNSIVIEMLENVKNGKLPSSSEMIAFLEEWVKNAELRRKAVQAQIDILGTIANRKIE
jgi:hypothetical protein